MLSIAKITDGVFFLKQNKSIHPLSTSNGFLITPSQIPSNSITKEAGSVLIDVNLEEDGWLAIKKFCEEQRIPLPSRLIMTHCHLDHSSHVHLFVKLFDGVVYAPEPEVKVILEHDGFFHVYQITEMMEFPTLMDSYRHLKYEILKFNIISEEKVTTFKPGEVFDFKTIRIQTIPLTAHSPGHVGVKLILQKEASKIFHNSCLGLDHLKVNKDGTIKDGFGPWYGFKHTNIADYIEDINKSEVIFKDCQILTSSHGIIFTNKKNPIEIVQGERLFIKKLTPREKIESPSEYMKRKIHEKEQCIKNSLDKIGINKNNVQAVLNSTELMGKLLDMDLYFSKKRIPPRQLPAYKFWERYLIINQLKHILAKLI